MRILITTLLLSFVLPLMAQKHNAFYDAQALKRKALNNKVTVNQEVLQILYRNANLKQASVSVKELQQIYKQNPFIAPYLNFQRDNQGGVNNVVFGQRGFGGGDNLSSNGMGLNPSTFLLGLTDFLVQRTKQELHIAFFKEFNKKVKKSEELRLLFPQTTETLITIEEEIYRFNAFWDALRESFVDDLGQLPDNLGNYFQESSKIKDPRIRALGADCFEVIDMLKLKRPPTDVIRYLGNEALLQTINYKKAPMQRLQTSLQLVALFSESLEYLDDSKYWVSPERFGDLIRDTMQTDLFLGFIYQKGKDISLGKHTLGKHLVDLRKKSLDIRLFLRTVKKFVEDGQQLFMKVQDLRRQMRNARRGNAKELTAAEKHYNFYSFTEQTINLIDYAYEFKRKLVNDSMPKVDSLYHRYVGVLYDLNKMIYDIQEKKYAVAIIEAIQIIDKLIPSDQFQCERKVLMKYGSFIAMAIRAKTPKEVSQAIESFALPPGSSAIKKFSKFSISLNAYVGAAGGYEYLRGVQEQPFYSIATPIGVGFNWGFKQAGSISIFASIIDIGALTAFRFDPNNTVGQTPLPDFKIENVFAPGGYLVYGVPKFPLAIGIGAQMGPNLRTVTNNGATFQTSGWHLAGFLAVDIPITNLYSTSKKYKTCKR